MRPTIAPTQALLLSVGKTCNTAMLSSAISPETKRLIEFCSVHFSWISKILYRSYFCDQSDLSDSAMSAKLPTKPVIADETLQSASDKIHEFVSECVSHIKSLCDGNPEQTPHSMLYWMNSEFNQVCRAMSWKESKGVSLCPLPDYDFLYRNPSILVESIKSLRRIVQDKLGSIISIEHLDLKPPSLSTDSLPYYIGFHYLMHSDVMLPSILFHELGHHIFVESKYASRRKSHIFRLVNSNFQSCGVSVSERTAQVCSQHIMTWIMELFCDLFAVRIAGPHFVFATLHYLKAYPPSNEFSPKYPSHDYRLQYQLRQIKKLNWFCPNTTSIQQSTFSLQVCELLRGLDNSISSESKAPPAYNIREIVPRDRELESELQNIPWSVLIDILDSEIPLMEQELARLVPEANRRSDQFWRQCDAVANAFNSAIVPSTIFIDGAHETVHPVVVLNTAGFLFQSGNISLLNHWPTRSEPERLDPERLGLIDGRLCEWTHKAIADWFYLHGI